MNASSDLMHTLAWSLLHFLWQGAAIAALAGALLYVMRKPTTRYFIGIAAVVLMLASFAITLGIVGGGHDRNSFVASHGTPVTAYSAPATATLAEDVQTQVAVVATNRDFTWVAYAWLAGVCLLALRIGFGLLVVELVRRRNLVALPEHLVSRFRALQLRLGVERVVRYCECHLVHVPAVIGFFRPVVLLPVRAMTGLSAEQLDAVIAHELGHIKRFDVAVNFIQVFAEMLFFFHPAVWWLNKRIRAEREDCCDDIAVATGGGNAGYARALAAMAGWRQAPMFAMAVTGGPVAARVARLLGVRQRDTGARTAGVFTASLVLTAALVAGAMAIALSTPARAQSETKVDTQVNVDSPVNLEPLVNLVGLAADAAQAEPSAPAAPASLPSPAALPTPAAPPAPPAPPAKAKPMVKPAPAARPVPAARPAPVEPSSGTNREPRSGSFIAEMKAAGIDTDVDQLIAMKSQGITTDYIRRMRATGLEVDANALIALKVQDVTPEYIQGVRTLGFAPDAHELVALKSQDVSPEYVQSMRELGIKPDLGELIALKVQGITPEYVKAMRAAGFNADTGELIAMKVQDITPAYRKAMSDLGFPLDAGGLIQAKVMDITPEFIALARSHGFKDLKIDQLIALKNADVL